MKASKIALGTAQFGLDYGIHNFSGQVSTEEIKKIFHTLHEKGINVLDTSSAYGEAEERIGCAILSSGLSFDIVSKFVTDCGSSPVVAVNRSLNTLGIDSLYGYLIHHFNDYIQTPELWDAMMNVQGEGKVKKIGFSLYHPFELELLLKRNIDFQIVQIPFNMFDQRFSPYFRELKGRDIEIHVRSVFLQGLLFKKPAELSSFFQPIKEHIKELHSLSESSNIPIAALALGFVLENPDIDRLVIGVDSNSMLLENIKLLQYANRISGVIEELLNLSFADEKMILPFNWE